MKVIYLESNSDLVDYINKTKNINEDKSGYSITPNFTYEYDHVLINTQNFNNILDSKFTNDSFNIGDISLKITSNKVKIKNKLISLSKKEHQLLYFLMSHYPRIVKKESISLKLWKKNYNLMSNTIEVHLNRLRKKIGKNKITCIKGFGYKLNL